MKIRNGPNFARSAKAPVMRAGVMMANISWNAMNSSCGMPVTRLRVAGGADALQAEVVEVADEAPALDVRPERQRVADDDPDDADEPHDDEALHDRAEDVLAADESRVEERQPGRHEEHQRRCGQASTRCFR